MGLSIFIELLTRAQTVLRETPLDLWTDALDDLEQTVAFIEEQIEKEKQVGGLSC